MKGIAFQGIASSRVLVVLFSCLWSVAVFLAMLGVSRLVKKDLEPRKFLGDAIGCKESFFLLQLFPSTSEQQEDENEKVKRELSALALHRHCHFHLDQHKDKEVAKGFNVWERVW